MRLRIPLILFFSLTGFSLVYYLFIQQSIAVHFTRLGDERAALNFGFASVLASGSFILLVLWLILDLILVRPLSALTRRIERIRRDRDLSRRLGVRFGDEIGALALAFNGMMDEIEQARSELRDTSFRLGMAEMASGVLHNVRNSLTPFTGHLQLAKQTLEGAALADLRRAVGELADCPADAARRAELAEFARLAVDDTATRMDAAVKKLDKLAQVVKKIETILVEHGRTRPRRQRQEPIDLGQAIRDGLTLAPEGYLDGMDIVIEPSVEAAPKVCGNAVILQQVVANLVCNAAEASARAKRSGTVLTISAKSLDGEAGPMVETVFADNGPGFAVDQAERVFSRGSSSKPVASGLGLHWCANAITAMGGRMSAASFGAGQGAAVGVILPAWSES
jgi:signal transduction histidine kinase